MFKILLILFIVIPFIEVSLLIKVGSVIGAWPTILIVVLTAVGGAALMRIQGLVTLLRVQKALAEGQLPTTELLEGAVILVSGAMFLTPGFLTDCVGLLGLIPFTRRAIIAWALSHATPRGRPPSAGGEARGPFTIEGEYRREHEDK